ncbi:hypothetical protein VCUG_01417 [Vavraia culicis subsp. floridensis]|uniref:Uncharacterized protein n=1 Tax=Vavraia culicis (isolate floridensis) TaxID=948595 RepID=L2GTR2_VAVCU|nr:uncharacterized protein VCUG_01417 [Vavraia culicis subsp. floridensis]ELA47056.1 hypothetical protein VCUG_01417 [Vavraia culicis subsp. floridensis]
MDIKTAITQIIRKEFKPCTHVIFPEIPLTTEPSILLAIPYIRGVQMRRKEHFQNYIDEIKYYGLTNDCRFETRDDKIRTRELKQLFLTREVDFDDEEWVIEMLKYFYILAVEEVKYLEAEEQLIAYREVHSDGKETAFDTLSANNAQPLRCIQIDGSERKELLVGRIKPTLTLEEYSERVLERMRQSMPKEYEKEVVSELEAYDKEIEELVKMDEFKDEMVQGNTYRRA